MGILWITERALSKTDPCDYLVMWSNFTDNDSDLRNNFSIPEEVDNHLESYRGIYLKWLLQLKFQTVNGATLLDHFQIRERFSMWWMSLLVEKSQWKSSYLYDIFRLLALQKYLQNIDPSSLKEVNLEIKNEELSSAISAWLDGAWKGVNIRRVIVPRPKRQIATIKNKLAEVLRLPLYVMYNLYVTLRLSPNTYSPSSSSQVSFFSYFFNFDKTNLDEGIFNSSYWHPLYKSLPQFDHQYNWFHIFIRGSSWPKQRSAQKKLEKLNLRTDVNECHKLLEAQLDVCTLIQSFRDFFRLRKISNKVVGIEHLFSIEQGINFWALYKKDWHDSFRGKTALQNCLFLNIFESICSRLNRQQTGLYLQENQAWERALVYAWKKSGHGQIIGVQHASAADGDLRNFQHPDEYSYDGALKLPIPNFIGVNGNASYRQFRDAGFPSSKLLGLEALRYLYLDKLKARPGAKDLACCRLLVLGDYIPSVTEDQLDLLEKAAVNFPKNVEILIKSHPAYPIDTKNRPSLNARIVESSLSDLVNSYDIAYTSNITSASLDAFYSGKQVIILRDPNRFNMSPLRGNPNVKFIASPENLAVEVRLSCMVKVDRTTVVDDQFFYLDEKLPRYRKLLKLEASNEHLQR